MAELALYRKWRSKNFDQLLGQPHLTQTLKNALQSGKTAHAYLFCGPRGTGKTSAAKILAKALNCEKGPTPSPCSACSMCLGITQGGILDCIEIDAASNRGIDEIRDLREKVKFSPIQCRTKVYIIDEAHMLTPEAFNALLKTLEEPPPRTVFVLCTTEPHKLPPTVASRCQRFDFNRIGRTVIESRLKEVSEAENIGIEPEVFPLIAQAAEGSLRDALSLLDQLRTFCPGKISKEEASAFLGQTPRAVISGMMELIREGDLKKLLVSFHQALDSGIDLTQMVRDLLTGFRALLLCKAAPGVFRLSQEEFSALQSSAAGFEEASLYRILKLLSDLRQELRFSPHPELSAELGFMRLVKAQWEPSLDGLRRRVELLEAAGRSIPDHKPVIPPPARPPVPPPAGPVAKPPSVSLENLESMWTQLLENLRVSRHPLFATLREARPRKVEGNVLTLAFHYEFHKNRMAQKKEEIEKLLQEKWGAALRLTGEINAVDHQALLAEAKELFPDAVVVPEP